MPTGPFRQMLLKPIEQQVAFQQQLLLAIEERLESVIKYSLKNLRQIFKQILVTVDLSLGGL